MLDPMNVAALNLAHLLYLIVMLRSLQLCLAYALLFVFL